MTEVSNFAKVATHLAQKNSFDVIHAHDWLTYPAGIEAKQIWENRSLFTFMRQNMTEAAKIKSTRIFK